MRAPVAGNAAAACAEFAIKFLSFVFESLCYTSLWLDQNSQLMLRARKDIRKAEIKAVTASLAGASDCAGGARPTLCGIETTGEPGMTRTERSVARSLAAGNRITQASCEQPTARGKAPT